MKFFATFITSIESFFEKLDANGSKMPMNAGFIDGVRVIYDSNTGLYWEVKSPDKSDVNYCMNQYNFEEAKTKYTTELNKDQYGGFSDWRMPNKDELRSILDYGLDEIAIDTSIFENCQVGDYWTKNVYKLQPYFGWVIFFGFGSGIAKSRETNRYVMAVRGGKDRRFGEPDISRFKDNGDGTVTDEVTGLMWQKEENERSGAETAESICTAMTLGGFCDWRMPNIKEINTLLNLDESHENWFFSEMFPARGVAGMLHYASSSIFKNYYAWVTNFSYGYDGYYGGRQAPLLFRAVRDADAKLLESSDAICPFVITHTGETTSFNLEGHPIEPSEMQGGDASRSTVHMAYEVVKAEEVVKDTNTELMWDIAHEDMICTWPHAKDFITSMNASEFGGYSDWRLPTREELRSIVRYDDRIPAIDTVYFPNAKSDLYWTAEEDKNNSTIAWGIYFGYGCAIGFPKGNQVHVRAVRGGIPNLFTMPSKGRFIVNGDGTVTDKVTSLMWMQGETPLLSLTEALKYCEELELAGYDDWHLPNMKELPTIISLIEGDKWVFQEIFPDTNTAPQGFYMASTTYDATFGWGCNFQFGFDGYYADRKNGKYPFRPVRHCK